MKKTVKYFIRGREVGVIKAVRLFKSVDQFKEIKDRFLRSAGDETYIYIGGEILTLVK